MGCSLSGYSSQSTCEAAGGTWTSLGTKEYGYYIEGNKIAIVEKDTSLDNDLNSKDFGPGSNRGQWKSPLSSVESGLELLYSYANIAGLIDESSIIDVPNYLSKAIVLYVKSQYLEDTGQFKEAEYFMSKFIKQVEKHNNNVVTGPRMIAPGPNAIK